MNKSHKKVFLLLMLCAAGVMTGCNAEQILGLTGEELLVQMESMSEETPRTLSLEELEERDTSDEAPYSISVGDSLLYEGGSTWARDRLSDGEKIWYDDIKRALGYMQGTVKLSQGGLDAGLDESCVDKVFQSVLNDHPELFYVEGYSYTKFTRGNRTVAVEFTGTYNQDKETVYARKRQIEPVVQELIEPAMKLEDDYDKIKYAYEALIEYTDYQVDSPDNQNIYSVFVNGASVCQGYAKAFQYMMYRLDVDCALAQGTVIATGEGHAWNLVNSNGAYYYVDPTWGDISYQSAGQGEDGSQNTGASTQANEDALPGVSYDYLCITTEQLQKTHQLNGQENLPVCSEISDNYYVREDALFVEYDEVQLQQLVDKRLAEGRGDISLRCNDEACYQEMKTALLDRQELFTYLAGSGVQSFVYSCNDSQFTLTFFMVTSQR